MERFLTNLTKTNCLKLKKRSKGDFATRTLSVSCDSNDEILSGNAKMRSYTHPRYSPNLASFDYWLFLGHWFGSIFEEIEKWFNNLIEGREG